MTKDEKNTIAKLMLVIVNVFTEKPEYTLEQLRQSAEEAIAEAQKILNRKSY